MKLLLDCIQRFFPNLGPNEQQQKLHEVEKWCRDHSCYLFETSAHESCLLNEIVKPPPLLFVLGNPKLLSQWSLAIVGTRGPTSYGRRSAFYFAKEAAGRGVCVVSGLARGIDSAAHRGALIAEGLTIAVVGHGLDRIYPAMNRELAASILRKAGAIVSQYPPGIAPLAHHFPARNRIISGLSRGVLVVEAALKSGSLITAHHALEQNREVFVVPGRFDESTFQGSLGLIQQGAKLVREPNDLWEEFPVLPKELAPVSSHSPRGSDPDAKSALRWQRLVDVFRTVDYCATLQLLHAVSGWDVAVLSRELTAARDAGLVFEMAPQQFLWTGWD